MPYSSKPKIPYIQHIIGLIFLAIALIYYAPNEPSLVQRLLIPGLMVGGAWLVTRASLAVALAVIIIAWINIDWQRQSIILAGSYSTVVTLSGLYIIVHLTKRWRQHLARNRQLKSAQEMQEDNQ